MSAKQDRQGARTPADLERKWNFGKRFAEIMGIATDAREKVDSVESELRSEIAEQYTKISRDTEKIIMEALTEYVNTSDYDKFQQTVSAQFKLMSDEISANLKSTTELITSVDSDLQETKGSVSSVSSELQSTKGDLDSVNSDLQGTKENLESVNSDLQGTKEDLDSVNQDLQSTKENLTAVEQSINQLDSDLDDYTVATDGFKETVTNELTKAVNRLSGVEGDITETNESLSSLSSELQGTQENLNGVNEDLQTVKDDLVLHYEANSKFQEECESELSATAKQIALNMTSTTESFTEVNAKIESTQGDIEEEHRFTEELREYCESEFAASAESLDMKFQSTTEQITNVNGDVQSIREDLQKHFEFSANGLTIKAGEHEIKWRVDNELIGFYKGDIDESDLTKNRFGWWDGVNFHTGNIVVKVNERAQLGDFAFVPRSNGSLDFLKVGD